MRVPVTVPVGGRRIKIRYLKSLPGPDKDVTYGEFCCSTAEIRVNKAVHHTPQEVHQTVIHELFHAVFKMSGLENIIPVKQEEAIVSALENLLAPILVFAPEAKISYREVKFSFEDDQ